MKNIYFEETSNFAPSERIFFVEQLGLLIKFNKFNRVKNPAQADIVFATRRNVSRLLNLIGERNVPIILHKPHLERDTFLLGKSLLNSAKAIFNRLRTIAFLDHSLYISADSRVCYIADNLRIQRQYRSKGKNSFHLKLIPYPAFDNSQPQSHTEDRFNLLIGCIGEASAYLNLLKDFDFEYWNRFGRTVVIYGCFYGPAAAGLKAYLSRKCLFIEINWSQSHRKLQECFANVHFFIVPQLYSQGLFGRTVWNTFSARAIQPNMRSTHSKFSYNAGRNYFCAGLNKIFITQPQEDVFLDFPDYPSELYFEESTELNSSIQNAIGNEQVIARAYSSIDRFRSDEFIGYKNLKAFENWCRDLCDEI